MSQDLILNVDDTEAARYAKSRILQRAGFQVIEAASGGEALAKVASDRPTLVLLDTKLPDLSGFEVCRRLKQNPDTAMVLVLQRRPPTWPRRTACTRWTAAPTTT